MKILKKRNCQNISKNIVKEKSATYISLGFFDGVHLGHQALLNSCLDKAKESHAISTVILFDPHPEKVIRQLKYFPLLTPLPEKIQKIKQVGIQQIIVIDFTDEFQKISPEDFIIEILLKKFNMRAVFVGYNYHFGYQKKGNTNLIKELSCIYQFQSHIISPIKLNGGQKISSTIIKEYILKGEIEKANQLLGYSYQLTGKVIHGEKRGKSVLSLPTANIDIEKEKLLPKRGVYIALANIEGKKYRGLVNVGIKPTFLESQQNTSVEIYMFDFDDNIYGKKMSILLLKRIRDEKKFNNIGDLTRQIEKDKIIANDYFQEKYS